MGNTIKGRILSGFNHPILFIITISFLFFNSVNAASKAATYGPIKTGQSIWLIAKKTRPQGVSHEQMMNALFKLNPMAFENGDINRLVKGSFLNLPTSKEDVINILSGKSLQTTKIDETSKSETTANDSKPDNTTKTAKSATPASISENTKSAIKGAIIAQAESKKINFEWRDMGKMLKQAQKLAAEGKNDKATALAKMIVKHTEQAKIQAKLAKSVEPQFMTTSAPSTTTNTKKTTAEVKQVVATAATTDIKAVTEDKPKAVSTTTDSRTTGDTFETAKKAQAASKKLNFEWRDMGKMLKKAEKLATEGNTDKAKDIANMIVKHAEQAKIQAELAKSAGPRF